MSRVCVYVCVCVCVCVEGEREREMSAQLSTSVHLLSVWCVALQFGLTVMDTPPA